MSQLPGQSTLLETAYPSPLPVSLAPERRRKRRYFEDKLNDC